jgi:hypothetical protein
MRFERATRSAPSRLTELRTGAQGVEGAAFADLLAAALAHAPLLAPPPSGYQGHGARLPGLAAPLPEATLIRAASARHTLVVRVPTGAGPPAHVVVSAGPSGLGVAVTLEGAHMPRAGDVSRLVESRLQRGGERIATVRVRRVDRPAKGGAER